MSKPRKDGNYVATRRLGEKRIYAYSKVSQADADHNLNLKLQSLEKPREVATVRDAFREHIFPRWQNSSKATRRRYEADYVYIDRYIGDCPLSALSPKVAQDFVTALTRTMVSRNGKGSDSKPMAPKTVHHIFNLTLGSMKILTLYGAIPMNPFDKMIVSLPKLPAKTDRFMDLEDALTLLSKVPEDFVLVVWLGMMLGLREGEISGLQWHCISRRTREIRISQQRDKWTDITPTKGRTTRVLKVPQSFIDYIDSKGNLDSEFVCTNTNGKPYRNDKIYKRWMSLECRPEGWRFHDLRHLSAGLLTYITGDPRTAKTVLGHASIDTTALYIAEEATRAEKGFDKLSVLATTSHTTNGL